EPGGGPGRDFTLAYQVRDLLALSRRLLSKRHSLSLLIRYEPIRQHVGQLSKLRGKLREGLGKLLTLGVTFGADIGVHRGCRRAGGSVPEIWLSDKPVASRVGEIRV